MPLVFSVEGLQASLTATGVGKNNDIHTHKLINHIMHDHMIIKDTLNPTGADWLDAVSILFCGQ